MTDAGVMIRKKFSVKGAFFLSAVLTDGLSHNISPIQFKTGNW